METFLVLNGLEIVAGVDEQERTMLALAAGSLTREALVAWLTASTGPVSRG
jgi:death-on-curing protein